MKEGQFAPSDETRDAYQRLERLNKQGDLFDDAGALRNGKRVRTAVEKYYQSIATDLIRYNGHDDTDVPVRVEGRVYARPDRDGGRTAFWTTCYQHPHNPCLYDCVQQDETPTGKPLGTFEASNCFTIDVKPQEQ